VPLNDPFAGNAGASATTSISQTATEEQSNADMTDNLINFFINYILFLKILR